MKSKREPKSRDLPWVPKAAPRAVPACAACGAFQPDCLVPDGEGALAMCWPCAHAHVDHECGLDKCAVHECECLPEAIYPEKVIAARKGNRPDRSFLVPSAIDVPDEWAANLSFSLISAAVLEVRNRRPAN